MQFALDMSLTGVATIQRSAEAPTKKSAETKSASESASPKRAAEESAEEVLRGLLARK